MPAVTDRDAGVSVVAMDESSLIVNPMSSRSLLVPGQFFLYMTDGGWAYGKPEVADSAAGVKTAPEYVRKMLPHSTPAMTPEGVKIFDENGEAVRREDLQNTFKFQYFSWGQNMMKKACDFKCYVRSVWLAGQRVWWQLRDFQDPRGNETKST